MRLSHFIVQKARASSFLVGGSLLSQVVFVAFSPLITRLFSPDEFAVLNIYTSFVTLFAVFVVLRLDVALFRVGKRAATTILILGTVIAAAISTLLALAFLLFCMVADVRFPSIDLALLSALVMIGLVGSAAFQLVSNVAVAHGIYREAGIVRITQSLLGCFVQIAAGFLHFGAAGLIAGYIVSQSFGVVGLWRKVKHRKRNLWVLRNIYGFYYKYVMVRFRDFAFYSAPASVFNRFSNNMTVVLFAAVYDFRAAGLLALSYRAANSPLIAISKGLAQVFQKEYARPQHYTQRQILLIFIAALFGIGFVPTSVLGIFGPGLFSFVFGATWRDAGLYSAILAPAFLLNFISSPIAQALSLSDNHRQQLLWDIGRSVVISALFIILWYFQVPVVPGLVAISATLCAIYGSQLLMSVRMSAHRPLISEPVAI